MPRMGGSSRDSYTNVDTTVGTIVWVRRRNGSWWPGRIISDSDLSSANLLSPRSGTPVKLLGREDGSVDWYNIEKSKRVKPFRCGDFEECIEKAKAVAGLPTKKREKYARREDAILHALELEKQQLESSSEFIVSSAFRRENEREVSTQDRPQQRSRRKKKAKPAVSVDETDSGNSQVYPEEDSAGVSSSGKGLEEGDWNPGEDEVEGLPRMRGLQDFGLRSAGGRRRSGGVFSAHDENLDVHQSCVTQSAKSPGVLNGCNNVPHFTTKRKRTLAAVEDGSLRRRDRRRPLVQVLESSAKFSSEDDADLMHIVEEDDALVEGSQALGGMERLGVEFTSPAGEVTLNTAGAAADKTCCNVIGRATTECCVGGSLQATSTATEAEPLDGHRARDSEQQKSRRPSRKNSDEGTYTSILSEDWPNSTEGGGTTGSLLVKEEESAGPSEHIKLGPVKRENEAGGSQEQCFDVPVIQGNNGQKESVPMVLLASRLTKRPVVGYPVVVEPTEDTGDHSESEDRVMWRTARRSLREQEFSDEEDETLFKPRRLAGSPLGVSFGSIRKKTYNKKQHKESLSKKLLKKVVQSSRKTRTLSSIDYEQKLGVVDPNNTVLEVRVGAATTAGGQTNGCGWPVATCVPVKVALSRIKAAVTGGVES